MDDREPNTNDIDLDTLLIGLASMAPAHPPYDAVGHATSFAVYEK